MNKKNVLKVRRHYSASKSSSLFASSSSSSSSSENKYSSNSELLGMSSSSNCSSSLFESWQRSSGSPSLPSAARFSASACEATCDMTSCSLPCSLDNCGNSLVRAFIISQTEPRLSTRSGYFKKRFETCQKLFYAKCELLLSIIDLPT